MPKVLNRGLKVSGDERVVNSVSIRAFVYDNDGNIVSASGTTVPTADSEGFAKGCTFLKTDAADGVTGVYKNHGTTTACNFTAPSHEVVFAGQHATAGGDANEQATVSGALATDIVVASLEDNGTNDVTLLTSAAAANAINFVLSGDPSTDAVINYMVLRAIS